MRKITLIGVIILFVSINLYTANNFTVSFTGNYMRSSDSVYRQVYGSSEFYPEFKAGVKVFNNFYIWGGFGFLSSKGHTFPELNLDTKASKKYLSGGLGYSGNGKITFRIEAGLLHVTWKEEAMDIKNNGSAFGFRIGGGIVYNWNPTFFTEISSAYLIASDTVDDISLKLGGFIAGVGVGIRF